MCYRGSLKKGYDIFVSRNKCFVEQINKKLPFPTLASLGLNETPGEAGVVDFLNLIPPPHLVRFASLIGLGTPPVQEGILVIFASTTHLFLLTKTS